jgi:hypothetical protein
MKRSSAYPRLAAEDDFRAETDYTKNQNEIIERIIKARESITGHNFSQLKLPSKRYRSEKFDSTQSKKLSKPSDPVSISNQETTPASEAVQKTPTIGKEAEKSQPVLNLPLKDSTLPPSFAAKDPFQPVGNTEKFSFELGAKRLNRDFDQVPKKPEKEINPFAVEKKDEIKNFAEFSNTKSQESAKSSLFAWNTENTGNTKLSSTGNSMFSGLFTNTSDLSSVSTKFPAPKTTQNSLFPVKDSKVQENSDKDLPKLSETSKPGFPTFPPSFNTPSESKEVHPSVSNELPLIPKDFKSVFPVFQTSKAETLPQKIQDPPLFSFPGNPFSTTKIESQSKNPFNPISSDMKPSESIETKSSQIPSLPTSEPSSSSPPKGSIFQVSDSKSQTSSLFSDKFGQSLFKAPAVQSSLFNVSKSSELKNINYIPSTGGESKSPFHDIFKSSTFTSGIGSTNKRAKLTDEERVAAGQYPDLETVNKTADEKESQTASLRKEFITSPSVSAALASGKLDCDLGKATGSFENQEKSGVKINSLFPNLQGSGLFAKKEEKIDDAQKTGNLLGNSTSGTGVFGNSASGTGSFGNSTSGTGLFGNSTSGAGLFGNSTSGTGLFGSSTSGAGLLGNTASGAGSSGNSTSSAGLFGNPASGSGLSGTSGSGAGLFGNISSSTGLFGNNSSGLFGNSTSPPGGNSLFSPNTGSLFAPSSNFNSGLNLPQKTVSLFGSNSTSGSSGLFNNSESIKPPPAPPVKLPSNTSNNPFFVQSSEKIDSNAFLEEEGYASGASGSEEDDH